MGGNRSRTFSTGPCPRSGTRFESLGRRRDDRSLRHAPEPLHDRVREHAPRRYRRSHGRSAADRKSTRLNSSHLGISYAVFCLKKKQNHPPSVPPPCAPASTSERIWRGGARIQESL